MTKRNFFSLFFLFAGLQEKFEERKDFCLFVLLIFVFYSFTTKSY